MVLILTIGVPNTLNAWSRRLDNGAAAMVRVLPLLDPGRPNCTFLNHGPQLCRDTTLILLAQSIRHHEAGKRHTENVQRFLAEQERDRVKSRIESQKLSRTLADVERRAIQAMKRDSIEVAGVRVPPPPPPPPPPPAFLVGGPLDPNRGRFWGFQMPPTLPDRSVPAALARRYRSSSKRPRSEAEDEEADDNDEDDDKQYKQKKEDDGDAPPGGNPHRAEEVEVDGIVYAVGRAAAERLVPGSSCLVRAPVSLRVTLTVSSASAGAATAAKWEMGVVERVNLDAGHVAVRVAVPMPTLEPGSTVATDHHHHHRPPGIATILREPPLAGDHLRLCLGPRALVDRARRLGVDPIAVAAEPGGDSDKLGVMGSGSTWRAPTLQEVIDAAEARVASAPAAAADDDEPAVTSVSGLGGGWRTVAVREISLETAQAEARAAADALEEHRDTNTHSSGDALAATVQSIMSVSSASGAWPDGSLDGEGGGDPDEVYRGVRLGPAAQGPSGDEDLDESALAAVTSAGFRKRRAPSGMRPRSRV